MALPVLRRSPYAHLLAQPRVAHVTMATLLGGIASGMLPLALVLSARDATGSFAASGIVAGSYAIANSASAPFRGRAIDRRGSLAVLIPLALVRSASLTVVGIAVLAHLGTPAAAAFAAAAGLNNPPLLQCLRAAWTTLVPEDQLHVAYALQSVIAEVFFIAGPLVTAAVVAVSSPVAAIFAAAVVGVVATFWFITAARTALPTETAPARGKLLGALRSRGMWGLIAIVVPHGFVFGCYDVTAPAFASAAGARSLSGVLIAALSVGSIAGGVIYGQISWKRAPRQLCGALLVLLALATVPPIFAPTVLALGALFTFAGSFAAPIMANVYALVEDVRPLGAATEAFGWIVSAFTAGSAAGVAAAGFVVQRLGVKAGLGLAPAAALLSVVFLLVSWRALVRREARPQIG